MGELRAYALPVGALEGAVGSTGAARERFRALARQAFAPATPPDRLGPIYRRVPGSRVVHDDEPTPADLETFLDGRPVRPERAAATWRLVEAVVARLASASVVLPDEPVPGGLLAPLDLPVPTVTGLDVGWCPPGTALTAGPLRAWVAALPATAAPVLEVLVFASA